MPGVEVLVRYLVPGSLLAFPLMPVLIGKRPTELTGPESALALLTILVVGYLIHQVYWAGFDLFDFHRSFVRKGLRFVSERSGREDQRGVYLEWELWLHQPPQEKYGQRLAKLWLFFDTAVTNLTASSLGLFVLLFTSTNFDSFVWPLYGAIALQSGIHALLMRRRILEWVEFGSSRLFSPVPGVTGPTAPTSKGS